MTDSEDVRKRLKSKFLSKYAPFPCLPHSAHSGLTLGTAERLPSTSPSRTSSARTSGSRGKVLELVVFVATTLIARLCLALRGRVRSYVTIVVEAWLLGECDFILSSRSNLGWFAAKRTMHDVRLLPLCCCSPGSLSWARGVRHSLERTCRLSVSASTTAASTPWLPPSPTPARAHNTTHDTTHDTRHTTHDTTQHDCFSTEVGKRESFEYCWRLVRAGEREDGRGNRWRRRRPRFPPRR
jgi:hypothetical protein